MDSLECKLSDLKKLLTEEQHQKNQLHAQSESLKTALFTSEDTLSKLKTKLTQFEESALSLKKENELLRQVRQMTKNSFKNLIQTQKDATLFDSGRIRELTQMLNDEKDNIAILNVQLREKDGKIDVSH